MASSSGFSVLTAPLTFTSQCAVVCFTTARREWNVAVFSRWSVIVKCLRLHDTLHIQVPWPKLLEVLCASHLDAKCTLSCPLTLSFFPCPPSAYFPVMCHGCVCDWAFLRERENMSSRFVLLAGTKSLCLHRQFTSGYSLEICAFFFFLIFFMWCVFIYRVVWVFVCVRVHRCLLSSSYNDDIVRVILFFFFFFFLQFLYVLST